MITQRQAASGDILNLIDQKKGLVRIGEIESYLKNNQELAFMSINWLLQEGYARLVHKEQDMFLCKC